MSEKTIIHIDMSDVREGIPPIKDQTHCDKCGGELEFGFGLAGGGFGPYLFCDEHGIVAKDNEDQYGDE